ncbi:hypothetical protein ETB97_009632 [Aspergillus alliaceus]|uniref:Uncharacterized protein n=1 Tax=Petromyces alliaceus TaxID=209559 RepID=A0A8H5ZU74_PETAA|nr:hypothetical protein ETB97_009632 [Aspergillus burnettii]
MGWSLDYSGLAPGLGGIIMLGERGGLDAAACCYIERQKRERELALKEGRLTDDSVSETTLVPQLTPNTPADGRHDRIAENKPQSQGQKSDTIPSDHPEGNLLGAKRSDKGGFRAKLKEFKGYLR